MANMSEHASVVRVTTFVPAEGRRQELIQHLAEMAVGVRQQDGCFGAQICEPDDQPDAVTVISRWRDEAALGSLREGAGTGMEQVSALVAGPPATTHFRSIG